MFRKMLLVHGIAWPLAAAAHDYTLGDLIIAHPAARETVATAMAGAGYMSITNGGTEADRLVEVIADFPRVEIHDMVMSNDVASMVHLPDGISIAPGETVSLASGGKHVMFMGLNGDPLEVGEEVPATLVFEKAGRIDVVFQVESMADLEDHSTMEHTGGN